MENGLEREINRLARMSNADSDPSTSTIEIWAILKGHRIVLGKVSKAGGPRPRLLYDGKEFPGSTPEEARQLVVQDMAANPEKYFEKIKLYA